MLDVRGEACEHRPRPLQPFLFAAGKHRQRAVIGGVLAEHDWRIEHADAARGGELLHVSTGLRRDAARDTDHRAGGEAVDEAAAKHLRDLRIGLHHHNDDVGVRRNLGDGGAA